MIAEDRLEAKAGPPGKTGVATCAVKVVVVALLKVTWNTADDTTIPLEGLMVAKLLEALNSTY